MGPIYKCLYEKRRQHQRRYRGEGYVKTEAGIIVMHLQTMEPEDAGHSQRLGGVPGMQMPSKRFLVTKLIY